MKHEIKIPLCSEWEECVESWGEESGICLLVILQNCVTPHELDDGKRKWKELCPILRLGLGDSSNLDKDRVRAFCRSYKGHASGLGGSSRRELAESPDGPGADGKSRDEGKRPAHNGLKSPDRDEKS